MIGTHQIAAVKVGGQDLHARGQFKSRALVTHAQPGDAKSLAQVGHQGEQDAREARSGLVPTAQQQMGAGAQDRALSQSIRSPGSAPMVAVFRRC
ncbi:MAG: hypothetical protein R3E56_18015 [Burkholderiaceae bacterium]